MALSIPSFRHNAFFVQILKTAYRFNGTRFIEQVIKFSKSQASEFPSDQFVDLILQCLRELPEAEPQVVARLLKGETDYEVILLNTPQKSSIIARTTNQPDINSPKGRSFPRLQRGVFQLTSIISHLPNAPIKFARVSIKRMGRLVSNCARQITMLLQSSLVFHSP